MDIAQLADRLTAETAKIIYGKETQIRLIVMALLSQGHVLLEDLPGVGKTTLIKTLAAVSGCRSKRIQFVPDLLPADILGMNIYDRNRGAFRRLPGPVFTNLLLADEINRAVPRTQSALLEAMEERQVTIDGETLPLPTPFVVMATQNPVESESTFRLPAAQMDRFLIRLSMGYPAPEEERRMLFSLGDSIPLDGLETVTSPEELVAAQDSLSQIRVSPEVAGYLVSLVGATRSHPMVRMGASPRASRALFRAAREQGTPVNLYQTIQPRGLRFLLDGESFCGLSQDWRELEGALEVLASVLSGLSGAGVDCSLSLPHSRLFGPMTVSSGEGGGDDLLFYLAGYRCLAQRVPEESRSPQGPAFLPSRFAADAAPQSGTAYLITCSGSRLPAALMERLDPGQLWVLCAQDWEVPARAGFRSLSLDSLRKGGSRP